MDIKTILNEIETGKAKIAKERDKLHNIYVELGAFIDSCDEGIELLEKGKREIESGLDSLSEYV